MYEYNEHKNSVNSISFASQEYGLILICGSSDGYISIHEYKNEQWVSKKQEAHAMGVNSVSWGPPFYPITFQNEDDTNLTNSLAPLRFVSGGCDNLVKVWTVTDNNQIDDFENGMRVFKSVDLDGHSDWVRDVAWLNYVGYSNDTIVSCSEDESVIIWKFEVNKWRKTHLNKKFNTPTWKVSWSHCGSYLAVSAGDNCVYLFKENVDGVWEEISQINQDGNIDPSVMEINN